MNFNDVAEIRKRLHDCGQRTTIARITLIYILERSDSPMTTLELFQDARRTVNDRSTITRVLRDLEDLGFCRRIEIDHAVRYVATNWQPGAPESTDGSMSQETS